MIKRVSVFRLKEGKDPDEAWKVWSEVHAPEIAQRVPTLRKYIINRAIKGTSGTEPTWWGVLEQWFDSEEVLYQDYQMSTPPTPRQKRNAELWASFHGESVGQAFVEEKIIIPNTAPKINTKRFGVFLLQKGRDSDDAWKYWLEIHAVHFKDTMPGCRFYGINRVIKAIGGELKWWGLLEQRFDSEEAMVKAMSTPRPKDDFVSHYMDPHRYTAIVEEKVIV